MGGNSLFENLESKGFIFEGAEEGDNKIKCETGVLERCSSYCVAS